MKNEEKNEYIKERNKLIKKEKFANDVREGAVLTGGLFAGMATIGLFMGGAAEIGANLVMNEKMAEIHSNADFQLWVRDMSDILLNDLMSGKISFEEYKTSVESLLSEDGIIAYSQISQDENLLNFAKSYNQSKDLSKQTFKKGLPIFASMAGAGGAVAYIADKSKKKAEEDVVRLDNSVNEKN